MDAHGRSYVHISHFRLGEKQFTSHGYQAKRHVAAIPIVQTHLHPSFGDKNVRGSCISIRFIAVCHVSLFLLDSVQSGCMLQH